MSRVVVLKTMPDGGTLFREDGAHFILYPTDLEAIRRALFPPPKCILCNEDCPELDSWLGGDHLEGPCHHACVGRMLEDIAGPSKGEVLEAVKAGRMCICGAENVVGECPMHPTASA